MHFSAFLLVLALRISVEVRGTEIKGDTRRIALHDYVDPYNPSLIKNPNIRTKPVRKDPDCSDEWLRKIMHQNINDEGMTESKRAIQEATRDIEGSWSIICAPCAFSYLAHSQHYCIHSKHGITCLLYRDG